MSATINYTDIFDRLFPVQELSGLTDDSQIEVSELNRRYAIVRTSQQTLHSALRSMYQNVGDDAYRDFLRPFWEVAACESFTLTTQQITAARYRAGFDAAGLSLSFIEPRTAIQLNYYGGAEMVADDRTILVFAAGRLVEPTAYHVNVSQGGIAIYVWESVVTKADGRMEIVVLRRFNTQNVTAFGPYTGAATSIASQTAPYANIDIIVPDVPSLGNVYEPERNYRPLIKVAGDNFYRRPSGPWTTRYQAPQLLLNVTGPFTALPAVAAIDTTVFWDYEFCDVMPESQRAWHVPLLDDNGNPAPVWDVADIDGWINGQKLRPNIDFWINWGNVANRSQPPAVVFQQIPIGPCHIRLIKNAPSDPASEVSYTADTIGSSNGVIRMPPGQRTVRLARDIGIAFTGGFLDCAGRGIGVVCDNLAVHFKALQSRSEVYFRSRFVFTADHRLLAQSLNSSQTQLEELATLLSPSSVLPDPGSLDFVARYAAQSATALVPDVGRFQIRPQLMYAAFFFTHDVEGTGVTETAADARGPVPAFFTPWQQADGMVVFDGRENYVGAPMYLPTGIESLTNFIEGNRTFRTRPVYPADTAVARMLASFPWSTKSKRVGDYVADFRQR